MIDSQAIINVLKTVIDPELGQNIVDLGLVYNVTVHDKPQDNHTQPIITVTMTLTTPGCPLAPYFVTQVKEVVATAAGISVDEVEVDLTFDPPWTQDLMSEELKLQLGL